MANFRRRTGINVATATVTGVCPGKSAIVIPGSGFSIGLVQVIAANLDGGNRALSLYEDISPIAPQFTLGASGTLFWDSPGGEQLELSAGSGLYGCLDVAGSVDVTAYYVLHDNRTPITKVQARTNTYNAALTGPKAIRRPTRGGVQQEG